QKTAADIPIAMLEQTGRSKEELKQLKQSLYEVLNTLHGKK
ncbi:MarR family transcriptional regulator, partial [Bacteroides uniformis]